MTSVLQNGRELQFWERVDEVTFSGRLSRLNGSFLGKTSKICLIANTTTFFMALKNQKSVHGRGRGGGFRKIIGIHLVFPLKLLFAFFSNFLKYFHWLLKQWASHFKIVPIKLYHHSSAIKNKVAKINV